MNQKPRRTTAKPVTGAKGKARQKKPRSKRGHAIKMALLALFSVMVLTGVIVLSYVAVYVASFTNGDVAIDLDEYKANQNQTTIVYAKNSAGEDVEMARLHGKENRIWQSIDEMPEMLPKAAIALEDKRFPDHKGVDWFRTLSVTLRSTGSGGSTITQQLIKNLTGQNEVTFVRKFNEILSALSLEKHYSKKTIIEAYLNTLYLGEGCYGVKTAAEKYFGKDVKDLNIAECASLVSITKAPTLYDPLINPEENKERQKTCLENMLEQGYITQAEFDEAVSYEMVFTNSPNYKPAANSTAPAEVKTEIQNYYVDYVIERVIEDLMQQQGYSKDQATNMIYYGGLKIYTAADVDVQSKMESIYTSRSKMQHAEAQSAMVIMDYQGRIVGMSGGAGEKKTNRGFNRAVDMTRSPGSSIKPLAVYSPAIETGQFYWSSMINDSPIYVRGSLWPGQNAGGGFSKQDVTLQYGLMKSLNMIAGRVLDGITLDTAYTYATQKFRLSTLQTSDKDYSPLAMGSMSYGVTPLEMAAAYAAFGNGGNYYQPYCYYKVTNRDGSKVYLQTTPISEKALDPATADVMNELLRTVVSGGTGTAASVSGFQTFGKTGTTDDNKDKWFCGGTPYYVGAVWYGFDKGKNMGGTTAANNIFKAVMDSVHKGLSAKTFEKSGQSEMLKYCTKTGLLASDKCQGTAVGWYRKDKKPEVCTVCGGAEPSTSPDIPVIGQFPATTQPGTTAAQEE